MENMDRYFENLRLLQTLVAMYGVFGEEVQHHHTRKDQDYLTDKLHLVLINLCKLTNELIDLRIIDINSDLPRGLILSVLD